jgi:hypothetical protein
VGTILLQLFLPQEEAVGVEAWQDRQGPARGALAIVLAFLLEVGGFSEKGVTDILLPLRKRLEEKPLLLEGWVGSAMKSFEPSRPVL